MMNYGEDILMKLDISTVDQLKSCGVEHSITFDSWCSAEIHQLLSLKTAGIQCVRRRGLSVHLTS